MRSTFALLAVLSYVAVIGASPLGARAPAEVDDRRDPPCFYDNYRHAACKANPELCDTSGLTPPGESGPIGSIVRRQSPPNCTDHPDAPDCGPSPSPTFCDRNPKFCNHDPERCDTLGATTPADPALAKAVDRRQDPYCDDYPDAPVCNPNFCDVNPELCEPPGTSPPEGSTPISTTETVDRAKLATRTATSTPTPPGPAAV